MKRLRVMTVVGTRPEIIRLSSIIKKLNSNVAIEHILVHTGQNYDYELNEIFFRDFELKKPDYFLNAARGNAIETIGNILQKIDPILNEVKPDAFLVLGDTNSCLSAIAAKRRHIPIFHMEAGNRCFDQRVPEETNRKILDHIADINLPYSSIAREYLLSEGLPADRIIKTGSTMKEVLTSKKDRIIKSTILEKLKLEEGQYFLVSAHREENINTSNYKKLVILLNTLANTYHIPIIVSTHPRTRKEIENNGTIFDKQIIFIKPLGFIDYNRLQMGALTVLSDSGTISEESSILGFKAINLREAHERPEAMEEGTVILSGLSVERTIQALNILNESNFVPSITSDYNVDSVSEKIVRIIVSYVEYVKSTVYRE